MVGGGWQAAEADVEARVGGDTTGAEEGCGETLGVARALGRVAGALSGASLAEGPPPGPRQPDSDLGSQPRAYPVWEEKSLCNCPPAPPPAEEAPHPASRRRPCSAPPTHPREGTHVAHTVRNALSEEGAGGGGVERLRAPGEGTPCPEPHPPEPRDGRTLLPPA